MAETNIICPKNVTMNNPTEEEEKGTPIMVLTVDTMHLIFLKLQPKPLFLCRCVCHGWRNIINDSYFTDKYRTSPAARQPQLLLFRYSYWYPVYIYGAYAIEVYSINPQQSTANTFRLSRHPFDQLNVDSNNIGNLGNGLFFIQGREAYKIPSFLYNPVTCEMLTLPLPERRKEENVEERIFMYGLGFNNYSTKQQYKLVRVVDTWNILHCHRRSPVTEVYTQGSNRWKQIVAVPPRLVDSSHPGTPAYGDIHWYGSGNIVSFIVTTEEFKVTPLPEATSLIECYLFNWIQDLALLQIYYDHDHHLAACMNMWVLRDYENKRWEKLFTIPLTSVGCPEITEIATWEEDIVIYVAKFQSIFGCNPSLTPGLYRLNPRTSDITVMSGVAAVAPSISFVGSEYIHPYTINLGSLEGDGIIPSEQQQQLPKRGNYIHESSSNKKSRSLFPSALNFSSSSVCFI